MLHPAFTGAFKKDCKRAAKRGKDLARLNDLMRQLANEAQLDARARVLQQAESLSAEWTAA